MDDPPESPNVPKGVIEALYISTFPNEWIPFVCAAVYEHCWREEALRIAPEFITAYEDDSSAEIYLKMRTAELNAETCAARARELIK